MMCVCMSILNRLWWFCEEVMGDRGMEEEENEEDGCGGGEDEDEKGAEDEDEDRGEVEDVDGVLVVLESIFGCFRSVCLSGCIVVLREGRT